MEVLVVGNTAYVDDDFCAKAFPGDHVKVVAAQEARRDESSPHASWKELLQHLEQAYEFDRVVYLSNYLTPHTDTVGDIELLRSVFRTCACRRVQLLYVAGPAGAEGAADAAGRTGKGIIAHAANDLCRYYAAREGVQTKILRVPFLYTASAALEDPFLVPMFDACSTGSAALQGAQDAAFPLLCAEELSVLVRRIFDSWDGNFETLDVADTFHHTVGEVGEALQSLFPGVSVAYGDSAGYALPASDVARVRYGWFQRYDLLRDLSTIQARWDAGRAKKVNPLRAAIDRIRMRTLPIKCLETGVAWVLFEVLEHLFSQSAQLNVLDYRLLCVVLIGTRMAWTLAWSQHCWLRLAWRRATLPSMAIPSRVSFTSRLTGCRLLRTLLWVPCAAMFSCATAKPLGRSAIKTSSCATAIRSLRSSITTRSRTSVRTGARSWVATTALARSLP